VSGWQGIVNQRITLILWQTRPDFESEWARSNLQPEFKQIAAAIQKNSGNASTCCTQTMTTFK
jgi:hypothetical protein